MRLNKDVAQLLRTHGRDLTLTRTNSNGTYNTTTGAFGGGSTVTYAGRGVFINYVEEDIDGTTVQADDRKLLLQSATKPENGDRVENIQIIQVRTIQSGTTVVAYICQVRG